MAMSIVPLSEKYYSAYYSLVQATRWGNPMLPVHYAYSLWGMVVLDGEQVVGGWVGTLRGNVRVVRLIAKSVYFDSYPVFATTEIEQAWTTSLYETLCNFARCEAVVMLNLTHWVRTKDGSSLFSRQVPLPELDATFLQDLHLPIDDLWKGLDSSLRNKLRKAEKKGVIVRACKGKESVSYLADFQRLREVTQSRAIHHNANASMLLKSDDYFREIMLRPNSTLFVAEYEGAVVSASLILQGGKTVYFYMSGSNNDINRQTGCSAYLKWKAIEYFHACEGVEYVDMGGVPLTPQESDPAYGVYQFKKSFGGDYFEFPAGTIAISPAKYRLLRFLLSQRKLLRLFSNKL